MTSENGQTTPVPPSSRLAWLARVPWGGTLAGLIGVVIATFMSGCCGGAPSHSCMFTPPMMDAGAMDSSADANLACGFETCTPGRTFCCFQRSPPSLACIPVGQICQGQSDTCSGDADCQPGTGQHCCGLLATSQLQCQASCPGGLSDGTIRVCRSSAECPPDRPTCGQVQINGQILPACVTSF